MTQSSAAVQTNRRHLDIEPTTSSLSGGGGDDNKQQQLQAFELPDPTELAAAAAAVASESGN